MRYELQIVTHVQDFPTAGELADQVTARGVFHPRVAASGGFDRGGDSPRLLLEEDTGARVLVAYEQFAHAPHLAQQLADAPEPLRQRLGEADLQSLDRANAVFRLTVVQPGSDPANAVRLQVQVADVLVDAFGGLLVDPQMQQLWGAERWRAERALGELEVRRHVVIHADVGPQGLWMHTHGLVKFGKPDLEIFGVGEAEVEACARLLNRIARHLTTGGEIAAGEELNLGVARVGFRAGGMHQPNDFDNEVLVVLDAPVAPEPFGAPRALAALRG